MTWLISRPEEVSAAWLTAVFAGAGALPTGSEVSGFTTEPVGTGQMGDSVRHRLTFDGDPGTTPDSVVLKFTAADEASRATGITMRGYEVEVSFYRELADRVDVRAPRCWHADITVETGEFVLVLEDLAPAEQGDQMAGCSPDEAALALEELARLHAPLWGDPSLAELAWLDRNDADGRAMGAALLPQLYEGWVPRYQERLDPDVLAVGEELLPRIVNYLNAPEPFTVQHGDYRLDNLLFGTEEGGYPVAVVDWQTVVRGNGVQDASYFLGAGLAVEDRRAHETELLQGYHDALVAGGVEGYSWDDCWDHYRRFAFAGYLMAVGASMLVEQTDRGDEMFCTMATRHATHATDLDALATLSS